MSFERKVTTVSQPLIGGIAGWQPGQKTAQEQEHAAQHEADEATCRAASEREMSFLRALNPPRPQEIVPEIKAPVLADDFSEQVTKPDDEIFSRGVAVSREALVSLGKQKFEALLAADRAARTERIFGGSRNDFSSFAAVFSAFAVAGALYHDVVPQRSTSEQLYGANRELDQIRRVESFTDLWKLYRAEPRAVRAIRSFRSLFASLAFGQSLLERVADDGRARSKFFCGGCGDKVRLFSDWFSALAAHHRVTFNNSLCAIVFWLADETSEPPDVRELAREVFNTRVPSEAEIEQARALFAGFLLNHKAWSLWQFVGRRTQTMPDEIHLERERVGLEKRFPSVKHFHHEIEGCFLQPIASRGGCYYQFDSAKHRDFIDRMIAELRDCASCVAALAAQENSVPVTARFFDFLLIESKPKPQLGEKIEEKLSAVFPDAQFKVEIES